VTPPTISITPKPNPTTRWVKLIGGAGVSSGLIAAITFQECRLTGILHLIGFQTIISHSNLRHFLPIHTDQQILQAYDIRQSVL
jgi:hypothetical protein